MTSEQPPASNHIVRIGAWFAIGWERLWPLLIPLILVTIVFFSLSWLGIWTYLPPLVHYAVLTGFLLALLASLLALRHLSLPGADEVTRRIEIETELVDRPMLAQVDEMVLGHDDGFSTALWQEHRKRMRARLHDLASGIPRAAGDRFDPYGLRAMLPILAFVAFAVSYGGEGGKLSDAFRIGGDPAKLLTRLDVWVNPPDYTRKAPVYLSVEGTHQQGQTLILPQFSQLVGRFAGAGEISMWFHDIDEKGIENRIETENRIEIDAETILNEDSRQERTFSHQLTRSGNISVVSGKTQIAQWSLNVVGDVPPQISFVETPSASLSGSLQLSYKVEDDYGVTRASGLVELPSEKEGSEGRNQKLTNRELPAKFVPPANARPLIEPLEIRLSLPRRRAKSGTAKINRDVSKHPLAGSEVKLVLVAEDDRGQKGYSDAKTIVLPGRNFSNPISRALLEQRRILALDANQKNLVVTMLDAITIAPDEFIDDFTAYMALKVAWRRLINARSDDQLRDVMDLLWDVALGIEFGRMSEVERRLREAQERLSEALENGASDEEIDKLMKELRQAMSELMQALAEQARQNPQSRNPMMQNENARTLRQRDLERMMDRIENLAKSGSKDAARQLLSEMQRMMDNLRAGRHMQQRRAEGNQTNQALDQLSDLMQKQQKLMDETFRMDQQRQRNNQGQSNQQDQNNQQQGQRNENGENQNGDLTPQEYADALKQLREQQRALQEQLDSLNKQLQELGLEPSEQFGEAGEQMGKAGDRLGEGEAGDAVGNQGKALEALRRGAQSIMRQMAGDRLQGGQDQGEGTSRSNNRLARDPLGRNRREQGSDFGSDTEIPGEIDAQRAREVLEAIRKRLSLPDQPFIEKDYLERLLKSQ